MSAITLKKGSFIRKSIQSEVCSGDAFKFQAVKRIGRLLVSTGRIQVDPLRVQALVLVWG